MKVDFKGLEKGIKTTASLDSSGLTTFKPNMSKPIHRWYYFKEGFSSDLVKGMIKEFSITDSDKVIDCFSGVSTTVLTAQEMGIMAYGIEVNPLFRFIGDVKVNNGYNIDSIKYYRDFLLKENEVSFPNHASKESQRIPELSSFRRCFNNKNLYELLKFKNIIIEIDETKYRRLFLLALASIIENSSSIKKDGKGLKFIKKQHKKVSTLLKMKINDIISDVEWKHKNGLKDELGEVLDGDARNLRFPKNSFDLAIFSPPYLNSFDYTEVYKLELWLLEFVKNYDEFKKLSNSTLRSHLTTKFDIENNFDNKTLTNLIEKISNKRLWNDNIPAMIRSYFNDMKNVFYGLRNVLDDDGICAIVVGNSSYGGIPIPTDLFLGKIAEEVGFFFKELRIMRRLKTSSQQLSKYSKYKKYLRESIVVLENNK